MERNQGWSEKLDGILSEMSDAQQREEVERLGAIIKNNVSGDITGHAVLEWAERVGTVTVPPTGEQLNQVDALMLAMAILNEECEAAATVYRAPIFRALGMGPGGFDRAVRDMRSILRVDEGRGEGARAEHNKA